MTKELKIKEPVFFKNQMEFRHWLEKNHDKENELLVGFYKVGSGRQNMTWSESVDQALCFGWIDGIRRSIDDDSYCIRFTPRRQGSTWSAVNIRKIEELNKQGLMHQAGTDSFNNRKLNKTAVYNYENELVHLPAEMEQHFKKSKKAWLFFNDQAASYKKTICRWIMDAKQEPTRFRRLEKVISESAAGNRLF